MELEMLLEEWQFKQPESLQSCIYFPTKSTMFLFRIRNGKKLFCVANQGICLWLKKLKNLLQSGVIIITIERADNI